MLMSKMCIRDRLKGDNYALKMEEFPDYKYYDFVGKYVYVHN